VSPATIRNAMMDLEEMGLVYQPFTSAGRVPTDAGYRYYIDTLLEKQPLSLELAQRIDRELSPERASLRKSVETACRILASLSNQLGIVVTPALESSVLGRLELVRVSSEKLLVVLTVRSGATRTLVVSLSLSIDAGCLADASRLLNERLCGLTLAEINESFSERTHLAPGQGDARMREIIDSTRPIFEDEPEEVHLGGTCNIVRQPEFHSSERLEGIFGLIERRGELISLLKNVSARGEARVSVGDENPYEEVKDCSVVAFSYTLGSSSGAIGILGPTRMPYGKVLSLVEYVGNRLNSLL